MMDASTFRDAGAPAMGEDGGVTSDAGSPAGDAGSVAEDAGPGLVCEPGTHECDFTCVPDVSVDHCGDRCDPCPSDARTVAVCEDLMCNTRCSAHLRCDLGCCTASAIVASGSHTCALSEQGRVLCWGHNSNGRLGDGTDGGRRNVPSEVVGLTDVALLSTGRGNHTCAVRRDASVWCWGYNDGLQLGDGTRVDRPMPVQVVGLPAGAVPRSISTGSNHTCTAFEDGRVFCWGSGGSGRLGQGSTRSSAEPVEVIGLSDAVEVSLGNSHSCARTSTGAMKCWGFNANGELGDGTTESRHTATDVMGLDRGVTAIAAGAFQTCAIVSGQVRCWGRNRGGELGGGTMMRQTSPTPVLGLASGVTALSVGDVHACAVDAAGGVWCWGLAGARIGAGFGADGLPPQAVLDLPGAAVQVEVANTHSCAITRAGAYCWGFNTAGQVGDGTFTSRSSATAIVSP